MVAANDGMTRDSRALASIHATACGDCYHLLGFRCLVIYSIYNIPHTPDLPEFIFLGLFNVVQTMKGLRGATERITCSY